MKYSTIQYYRDCRGNVYREKKRYCTGIKDIDAKIFSYLEDDLLVTMLQTNHYINSLATETWKLKIILCYHNLPLPVNINYQMFYYSTRSSYSSLSYHAFSNGYNKILDWLILPENSISYYVELGVSTLHDSIESGLKLDLRPNQRSVNYSAKCGNLSLINLLGRYQIYPDINYILRKEYTDLVRKLLTQNQQPSQKAVDYAYQQKEHKIIHLLSFYNIHPSR